jgi:hypothetical protein
VRQVLDALPALRGGPRSAQLWDITGYRAIQLGTDAPLSAGEM